MFFVRDTTGLSRTSSVFANARSLVRSPPLRFILVFFIRSLRYCLRFTVFQTFNRRRRDVLPADRETSIVTRSLRPGAGRRRTAAMPTDDGLPCYADAFPSAAVYTTTPVTYLGLDFSTQQVDAQITTFLLYRVSPVNIHSSRKSPVETKIIKIWFFFFAYDSEGIRTTNIYIIINSVCFGKKLT